MKVCLKCGYQFESVNWNCPDCLRAPEYYYGRLVFAPELAKENNGFSASYFAPLAELERGHFWFESRNRLIFSTMRRYFSGARNFLEIGCGTGYVLSGIKKEFPGLVLWGSEIFSEGLAFAEKRLPGATLFQMDGRNIPFKDEFDVIGAFDVLEHIEEDKDVLFQMFRATKSGGGIILTVPQHRFLWSVADDYAHHKRRYTRNEIVGKLKEVGWEVIRITSFISLLLPLMFLSRMKYHRSKENYDPSTEFRIGGILNASLKKVLDLERILIQVGISFPIGGSLLVVARKK